MAASTVKSTVTLQIDLDAVDHITAHGGLRGQPVDRGQLIAMLATGIDAQAKALSALTGYDSTDKWEFEIERVDGTKC